MPYRTRERYWVRKMVAERRLIGYDEIEHRDPVHGWREERRGGRAPGARGCAGSRCCGRRDNPWSQEGSGLKVKA